MEKEELQQTLKEWGFHSFSAIRVAKNFGELVAKQFKQHPNWPLSKSQLAQLISCTKEERDIVMLLFPITTEAPGEKDITLKEFAQSKTTPFKLPNLLDFVETKNFLELPIYQLTPAFARIHYYKYITKAIKTVVVYHATKNKIALKKSAYQIFSNSQLPEKFLTLICNLATVGKNNLLIPHSGTSSIIIAGILFEGKTITENGNPLPIFDEEQLLSKKLPLNLSIGVRCKNCSRCQTACPASALTTTVVKGSNTHYLFEKEKCLQFLSHIEGEYPSKAKNMSTPFFYGCSICQRICPHYQLTKEAILNRELALKESTPTLPKDLTPHQLLLLPKEEAIKTLEERLKKSSLGQKWIDKKMLFRNLEQL